MSGFIGVDECIRTYPWLTKIPQDWSAVRLKFLMNSSINGIWGDEPKKDGSDVWCVRVADFNYDSLIVSDSKKTFRFVEQSKLSSRLLHFGDLLIEKSGGGEKQPVGRVVQYLFSENAVSSNFVAKIDVNNKLVQARFLTYIFSSLYSSRVNTRSINQTTGIQNLDAQKYFDEVILLPPLPTQQLIATYLDRKTQAIDALITAREEQIARLQEKRASLIHRAVTKGITEGVEMKDSGIEWIGEIPKHWATLRLGLATSQNKRKNKGMVENNVLSLSYGRIKKRNVESNMGLLPASFETYQIVEEEDLIFRLTDLQNDKKSLRVGRATQRGIITSAYLCLRCRSFADSQYFYLLLHNYDLAKVFYSMGGGVRQSLTYSEFAILPVVLPPLDEQKRIASYVFTKRKQIDSVITALKESITTLKEYRQSLITEAVTGKLDPQAMQAYLDKPSTIAQYSSRN